MFVCPSQSETSFSIFRLFRVLIELCYRLSMSRNSNPRLDFSSELSLVRNSTNQVSRPREFDQSGFEGRGFQPIRFWGAGISTNQVARGPEFSQWNFSKLEFQSVKFLEVGISANPVSQCPRFGQSGCFWSGYQPNRFRWVYFPFNQAVLGRSFGESSCFRSRF